MGHYRWVILAAFSDVHQAFQIHSKVALSAPLVVGRE